MGKQGRGKTSPILGAHLLPSAGDSRIAQGRWAGSAGGLGQNVSLVEWLLKGRGVGCLPKDAEKPTRGGTDGHVARIYKTSNVGQDLAMDYTIVLFQPNVLHIAE